MSSSPIGGASESTCPAESVDEQVSVPGHSSGFYKWVLDALFDERVLRRPPSEACLFFFSKGAKLLKVTSV